MGNPQQLLPGAGRVKVSGERLGISANPCCLAYWGCLGRGGVLGFGVSMYKRAVCAGGFSLLEVLVAATLLAVAVIGTGYLFVAGQAGLEQEEWLRAALEKASQKMEELRGLPLSDSSLKGEPEPGREHLEPSNPVVLEDKGTADPSDDLKGYLRWRVVLVDDPRSGAGEDYLLVRVEVSQDSAFSPFLPGITLETLLAR